MAPRVLVDATAVPADRGGVGRYVDGLLTALDAMSGATTAPISLAVVSQRADAERYRSLLPKTDVVAGPAGIAHRPARLTWEQSGLPLVARDLGAELVHSPYYTMPLHLPVPVVVTVHDVTYFSEPELHSSVRGGFYRSAIRTTLPRANRVVVPSQATRDELVGVCGADPSRLHVARHGVDTSIFHPPTDSEVRRVSDRLGLRGRSYVAYLGELGRRKNVPALVRGFVQAVGELADPPALVLAGGIGWDDELDAAVAQVPARLRVVQPGYLRAADLRGLLGGADVVAHPSAAEGFGLPVLEAMACGAAVLTSRRRSLPEVGGEAVEYTEPDAASIGAALRRLLEDAGRRAALSAAAVERARSFPWTASAEAHVTAYTSALQAAAASA